MCRPISECFITSFIFFRMVSVFECIKEGKQNYVCIIMNKRLDAIEFSIPCYMYSLVFLVTCNPSVSYLGYRSTVSRL